MRPLCSSSCCRCKRTHILGLCRAGIVSHTSTSHLLTGCVCVCVYAALSSCCRVLVTGYRLFAEWRIIAATTDRAPPWRVALRPRRQPLSMTPPPPPPPFPRHTDERADSAGAAWKRRPLRENEASIRTSSSRYEGLARHKVAGRGVREVGVIVFESEVNRIRIQWAH